MIEQLLGEKYSRLVNEQLLLVLLKMNHSLQRVVPF